jgi:hypothetical protein
MMNETDEKDTVIPHFLYPTNLSEGTIIGTWTVEALVQFKNN